MHPLLFDAVFLAAFASVGGIGQDPPAADAIVRRPVELLVPPGPTTFTTLQLLLLAADVPYGLEQAPPPAAQEPIDLGRPGTRSISLERMKLRDALDAMVREDPRYVWRDQGGRILVRAATADGHSALDAPVPAFVSSDASFVTALTALVDAIDPARPRPHVGGISLSIKATLGVVPTGSMPATVSRMPVAHSGGTLLDALTTIARAYDHLSWTVQYDGSGTSLQGASITVSAGPMIATAPTIVAEVSRSFDVRATK